MIDSVESVHQVKDSLGFAQRKRVTLAWSAVLTCVLLAAFVIGIIIGPTPLELSDVWLVLKHHLAGGYLPASHTTIDSIVWHIRVPRLLLGAAVGAGLAVAGAVLQAVVRNVLADPYTLGINSGASTGAALAILFGVGAGFGQFALQGAAFVGAMGASILMFAIAQQGGQLSSPRLLMSGVVVGYTLSAVTSFLVFASDSAEGSRSVMFWLLGSLALGKWDFALALSLGVVILVVVILWLLGTKIDALTIGDDAARTLGVHPDRLRITLTILTCLMVGTVVSMAGSIGFVGLVVPHACRRLVGGSHRHLLPVSALAGAALLLLADITARVLLAPQEIPIGILTATVGAPLLFLIVRRANA
ncbi:ABC transporter integral membrane protein [Actinobaculum suis]|uniref:ABC transporter integral membrane protein n=1 Tax=Actinobaculum suis TaxID=1657 RepID=A0A7Z9C9F2_9ACTO|nr:ABC transporter integral membrane protein [Actinobaculum suis]